MKDTYILSKGPRVHDLVNHSPPISQANTELNITKKKKKHLIQQGRVYDTKVR